MAIKNKQNKENQTKNQEIIDRGIPFEHIKQLPNIGAVKKLTEKIKRSQTISADELGGIL